MSVPSIRIRSVNQLPVNEGGEFVLYWMIANRRTSNNFSLDRALEWCKELGKPLLILEALRCGYRWANDRIHRFVMQGMAVNRRSLASTPVGYYCYLESNQGDGAGMLETIASRAAVVVTDDFPCFFLPSMVRRAAKTVPVAMEDVDSNGILPMRAADKIYPTAYAFRRFLQKELPAHFDDFPEPEPIKNANLPPFGKLPEEWTQRWPEASDQVLTATPTELATFPIDHSVGAASFDGGSEQAMKRLETFVDARLDRYHEDRSKPDEQAASELSPYLHFGHISVHQVMTAVAAREGWTPQNVVGNKTIGKRSGWWSMSEAAESFMDELITWRELGYNMCWQQRDYDKFESLPPWAQETLDIHSSDDRPHCYSLQQLEQAATHDPLWNAAQRQLVDEGRMHNYLRMLWGKKILEWTESPRVALDCLIELNNKYAVDGRNPNSYSGIFWCLGRYDRAWGPERQIFGKIRYMSSDNTARKFNVKPYLARYAPGGKTQQSLF